MSAFGLRTWSDRSRSTRVSGTGCSAWVTDPDGYRIELVQWPAGHPQGMTEADFTNESSRGSGSGRT
jgi:hypothetical protein